MTTTTTTAHPPLAETTTRYRLNTTRAQTPTPDLMEHFATVTDANATPIDPAGEVERLMAWLGRSEGIDWEAVERGDHWTD
jgi:hypothetical protein